MINSRLLRLMHYLCSFMQHYSQSSHMLQFVSRNERDLYIFESNTLFGLASPDVFCIPAAGRWHGLSPNLASLYYSGYSATPDPRKKSIMKLYKLRWHAVSLARKGMCELSRGSLSPLAVQQVHRQAFRRFLWCVERFGSTRVYAAAGSTTTP